MSDIKYMKRALELAEKGVGAVNPNPLVGAVIVKDGRVISEGWHERYGEKHAERNALEKATEDVAGAEMYVTLEPCSHYGKTPPCTEALIKSKIKKVFISMTDPNPLVAGRGIAMLKEQGIEVITGMLEAESQKQNEVFLKYITQKRPFCLLKTAMTLDGKIAAHTGDSKWVTGEESRQYVHQLRHRYSGIMAGINTVLADDPVLTTRLEGRTGRNPFRIITDTQGRIPLNAQILNLPDRERTIVACGESADPAKLRSIREKGATVVQLPEKDGQIPLPLLMEQLGHMGIDSILLEGGGQLAFSALSEGVVDKLNIFIAPKILGGSGAKTPVEGLGIARMQDALPYNISEIMPFGRDLMLECYPVKSQAQL